MSDSREWLSDTEKNMFRLFSSMRKKNKFTVITCPNGKKYIFKNNEENKDE